MDIYTDELTDVLVLGDFKITWAESRDIKRRKYANILKVLNLKQLIRSPTRVTCTSSTVIDHVLTNRPDIYLAANTIDCGVSDHLMIYTN